MNEIHLTKEESHRVEHYEDDILLIDILRVIWKWKYFILLGTSVSGLIAAIISFSMPKIYRIDITLEPGIARINQDGVKVYINEPENIKTIIETNVLNNEIAKYFQKTNGNNLSNSPKFDVSIPKGSNIIKVSYETENIDSGIKMLKALYEALREKYEKLVKYYSENYDRNIQSIKTELDILNDQSASYDRKIKRAQKRIKELEYLINDVDKIISNLIRQRNEVIHKKENGEKSVLALLYNNAVQQNILLTNQYRREMKNYLDIIDDGQNKDIEIRNQKQKLSLILGELEFKKSFAQNIKMLQSPTATAHPIKPKTKLNVILALVAGLFLMLFLSFFLQYLSEYKISKEHSSLRIKRT